MRSATIMNAVMSGTQALLSGNCILPNGTTMTPMPSSTRPTTSAVRRSVGPAGRFAVRKRLSAGYTVQMAYTFSKSLDTGSYSDSDGTTDQDPNNLLTGEYARSDFSQTQLFRLNGVWDLPQFKNLGL